MPIYNTNDSELDRLVEVVQNMGRENPFESSSIRDGMIRFIRGVLKLEGGALLDGDGTFRWRGRGSIAGDWEVLEGGVIKVGAVLISPVGGGRIMVGQGPVAIILDGGSGSLTMGNVRIQEGKIFVNDMVLDPSIGGGALTFPNGSRLEADAANTGARLIAGTAVANVGDVASLRKGSTSVIISTLGVTVNAPSGEEILLQGAVRIPLASVPTYAGTGLPQGTLRLSTSGRLERADGT